MAMEAVNRIHSPMHRLEENYGEDFEVVKQKKEALKRKQRAKSPFVIGSIDDLNRRISRLDRQLASYSELVCDSAASEYPDYLTGDRDEKGRQQFVKKDPMQEQKEQRELTKFAGIYSIKATFGFNTSDRAKKIAKINPHIDKTPKKEPEKGKPKFVELHQFPGFDHKELTKLPDGISAVLILDKVAKAQKRVMRGKYLEEFNRYFFSQLSQALLQDVFWYFFLDRYGSEQDKHYMSKFFNRTAHNYVKLIFYCREPHLKETFLNDYPNLMAQALYASFCEAFPDSHAQFTEVFKEDLISMVFCWFCGMQPAKRLWQHWDYSKLEPAAMKLRQELMQGEQNGGAIGGMKPTATSPMRSSRSAGNVGILELETFRTRDGGADSENSSRRGRYSRKAGSSRSSSTASGKFLETARKAQGSALSMGGPHAASGGRLSPIREGDAAAVKKMATANSAPAEDPILSDLALFGLKQRKKERSAGTLSHPACRGPDYLKLGFNLSGQSPLVDHFLRCKNQQYDAGTDFVVRRTEVHNHPPIEAKTYSQVIREANSTMRQQSQSFKQFHEKSTKEGLHFQRELRALQRSQKQREVALLSNPKEVKRLSNLLVLEMKKDSDSISFGADAAVEEALVRK